jgi:hypothetical protein
MARRVACAAHHNLSDKKPHSFAEGATPRAALLARPPAEHLLQKGD